MLRPVKGAQTRLGFYLQHFQAQANPRFLAASNRPSSGLEAFHCCGLDLEPAQWSKNMGPDLQLGEPPQKNNYWGGQSGLFYQGFNKDLPSIVSGIRFWGVTPP
jgi:hypothetical protein